MQLSGWLAREKHVNQAPRLTCPRLILNFRGKACMSPCYKGQQSYKEIARLHSCKHGGRRFSWSGFTRVFFAYRLKMAARRPRNQGFSSKFWRTFCNPWEILFNGFELLVKRGRVWEVGTDGSTYPVAQTVTKPKVLLHFFNKLQAMYGRNSCFISVHFDALLQHCCSHITTSLYRGKVVVLF